MILLFIPEKDTEKILDAINKNLKGENKEEINIIIYEVSRISVKLPQIIFLFFQIK